MDELLGGIALAGVPAIMLVISITQIAKMLLKLEGRQVQIAAFFASLFITVVYAVSEVIPETKQYLLYLVVGIGLALTSIGGHSVYAKFTETPDEKQAKAVAWEIVAQRKKPRQPGSGESD